MTNTNHSSATRSVYTTL